MFANTFRDYAEVHVRVLTYYNCCYYCIVCEHWSDTREYITRSAKLWNKWIRLSCYYSRV